jgi:hypothetical protein
MPFPRWYGYAVAASLGSNLSAAHCQYTVQLREHSTISDTSFQLMAEVRVSRCLIGRRPVISAESMQVGLCHQAIVFDGDCDAFVTKLSCTDNQLTFSTFLGGSDNDHSNGIAVDGNYCAYVTGGTSSSDFPSSKAYGESRGRGSDAFVTKFTPSGNPLFYSTTIGGSQGDFAWAIAVDGSGYAYVVGQGSFTGSFMKAANDEGNSRDPDVFVVKFPSSGEELEYSTTLGGSGSEWGHAVAVDGSECAYLTGMTTADDFPTTEDAYDPDHNGGSDVFVTKLNTNPSYVCGDPDASGGVDIDDVVYLIAYIFSSGPEPLPYLSGDADCSTGVDIDDVVYLIAYIFSSGYAPCDPDGDEVPDC